MTLPDRLPALFKPLFDQDYLTDPYAVYDTLRTATPVVWNEPLNAWIVTRADDVRHVFQTPTVFSSNRVPLGRARFPQPELTPLFDMVELLMLQRDDPQHTRLRRLVAKAFGKTAIASYSGMICDRIDALTASARDSDEIEFLHDFAVPLPVLVISEIVGIPAKDREQVKAWCDAFSFVALNFYARITDEQLANGLTAITTFRAYLADLVEDRRHSPRDDLLSALVAAEEDGDRLSFDELLANTILLLNAGNETTTVLLTHLAYQLATSPDVQTRLRADPTLIAEAVEESLRHRPPVQFLGRIATQTTDLAGQTIAKGDLVLIFLGAAGRDPDLFTDPNTFSIDRGKIHHLSFGSGPHVCAGLQLARLEAVETVTRLLQTFSDIRLADTDLGIGPNLNLRNFARLPLTLTPK